MEKTGASMSTVTVNMKLGELTTKAPALVVSDPACNWTTSTITANANVKGTAANCDKEDKKPETAVGSWESDINPVNLCTSTSNTTPTATRHADLRRARKSFTAS
jgi:hypothetical protein